MNSNNTSTNSKSNRVIVINNLIVLIVPLTDRVERICNA
jgi:hypothetical protein